MIKIINNEINDFIEFLNYNYPKKESFYLHICEGHDSIQDPYTENLAFGMFNRETNHCYVAGDLEEEQVLKTMAHEYKHFLQKCDGVSFNEEDAENFADLMYNRFTCEIRKITEECEDCGFCEKKERSVTMKYKKKPVIIEAIQFDGLNLEEIKDFVGDQLKYDIIDSAWQVGKGVPHILMEIETLEGDINVSKYDYIIKGVQGEFYPCKPDIFEKTYEIVEER